MSLYERLDRYLKLSLEHFTYKKRDASWSHVLHLLSIHTQFEKITQVEAESLKLKARGYYDKRVRKLEKNIRWRKNKKSAAKQADEQTTTPNATPGEYKMDCSLVE